MNQEEIERIDELTIDLNTDLRILKNAVTNPDNDDLYMHDLVDFVEKISKISEEVRNVFTASKHF